MARQRQDPTPSEAVPDLGVPSPPPPDLAADRRNPVMAEPAGPRVPAQVLIAITAVLVLALLVSVLVSVLIWHRPAPTPVDVPSVGQA